MQLLNPVKHVRQKNPITVLIRLKNKIYKEGSAIMKMKKKIISLLLLMFVVVSMFTFVSVADENEEIKNVPPLGRYSEAVNTLAAIGIVQGENFDVSSPVTRGEFVGAVVKMCGVENILLPCDTEFSDVGSENPYSGAIKAAAGMGITKGFGDGTFQPDKKMSSEQAVKMIVSALGYGVYAEAEGGYPVGYITVGYTAGLLANVILSEGAECTWGNGAQLLYNALETDILFDIDLNGTYRSTKGENPLTKWLNMNTARGVVAVNNHTSLRGNSEKCADGYVMIDGEKFFTGSSSISDMLGYKVNVYYKTNNAGEKEVVYSSINKNIKIYEICADDIMGDTDINKIVYLKDKSKTQINISGAAFIYNKKYTEPTSEKLDINDGKITVIDNDSDGKGDVVLINEKETVFVDRTNTATYSVYDKFTDEKFIFDVTDNNNDITFFYDGKPADFKKIKAKNVLTVQRSEDSSVATVYIANKTIKATAADVSDKEITFTDGTVFRMTDGVKKDRDLVSVGEEKKYYLTYDGQIGGFEISSGEGKYGYLIAAAAEGKGLAAKSSVTFRIFGIDGKSKSYVNHEKIQINGTFCKTADDILGCFMSGGRFEHQLIRFVTNKEDKITKIFTAVNNTAEPFSEKETEFTLDYYYNYDMDTGINYGYNTPNTNQKMMLWAKVDDSYGIFSNVVSLKGTKCIKVPKIPEGENLIDHEKDIQIVNNVSYFNRTTGTDYRHVYNLRAYDMNGGREAAVLVFSDPHSGGSGSLPAAQHIIVDYIAKTIDDDGAPTIRIYGYSQTGKVKYDVDSSSDQITAEDLNLQKGDVIRVATSPDVIRIVKLFTPHKLKPETEAPPYSEANPNWLLYKDTFGEWVMKKGQDTYYKLTSPWYDEMSVAIHGKAKGVTGNGITISMNTNTKGYLERIFPVMTNYSRYYVYDEANDTVKRGTINDIDPDSTRQTVMLRVQYNSAYEVFIYNWKDDVNATWIGNY